MNVVEQDKTAKVFKIRSGFSTVDGVTLEVVDAIGVMVEINGEQHLFGMDVRSVSPYLSSLSTHASILNALLGKSDSNPSEEES